MPTAGTERWMCITTPCHTNEFAATRTPDVVSVDNYQFALRKQPDALIASTTVENAAQAHPLLQSRRALLLHTVRLAVAGRVVVCVAGCFCACSSSMQQQQVECTAWACFCAWTYMQDCACIHAAGLWASLCSYDHFTLRGASPSSCPILLEPYLHPPLTPMYCFAGSSHVCAFSFVCAPSRVSFARTFVYYSNFTSSHMILLTVLILDSVNLGETLFFKLNAISIVWCTFFAFKPQSFCFLCFG